MRERPADPRLFDKGLALFEKIRKQPLLRGDAICGSRLVLSAGKSGGLLGKLSDIVANDGDAFVEFHERGGGHESSIARQRNAAQRRLAKIYHGFTADTYTSPMLAFAGPRRAADPAP